LLAKNIEILVYEIILLTAEIQIFARHYWRQSRRTRRSLVPSHGVQSTFLPHPHRTINPQSRSSSYSPKYSNSHPQNPNCFPRPFQPGLRLQRSLRTIKNNATYRRPDQQRRRNRHTIPHLLTRRRRDAPRNQLPRALLDRAMGPHLRTVPWVLKDP
jgi:hypothetical protein